MRNLSQQLFAAAATTLCLAPLLGSAQYTPTDLGQVVSGFQDDFTAAERDPNWLPVGAGGDLYEQVDGVLKVTVKDGDPNHLLYELPGYDPEAQEVLARIRVTAFGTGDYPRGGIGVGVDDTSSRGIALHFRDSNQDGVSGRQFKLLNDFIAWGPPGLKPAWTDNTWYWLRLLQTSSSSAAGNNIFGKVWPADGSVPEPQGWQMTWAQDGRVGFAGIAGSSGGGLGEFEVDYILIKAEGLPSITAASTEFPNPLYLAITQQPGDLTVGLSQPAAFTVQAVSSSTPSFRWQRATAGSSSFSDIGGATSANYLTPALAQSDNGTQYRAILVLPGTAAAVTSVVATVSVDGISPLLVYARTLGKPNGITLKFSEPVLLPANVSGFSIDGGATIQSVSQSHPDSLELSTSSLTLGTSYQLTVNGVSDPYANTIAANTKTVIDLSVEVPLEFGEAVNGFQDDFTGDSRDSNWIASPAENDLYSQANGVLTIPAIPGDPNHLLYGLPGYNPDAQEVLARVKVNAFTRGGNSRGGVVVGNDPSLVSAGEGINLSIVEAYDGVSGKEVRFLDDKKAWGPVAAPTWVPNYWYWLRLRQTASTSESGPNIFAKFWPADGTLTPEPTDWQVEWSRDGRSGFAGVQGPSGEAPTELEVDYILIKAEGLPSVSVAAGAFAFGPYIKISQQPSDLVVPPGQPATFKVVAAGSGALTYQWQKASAGTSIFVDLSGANSDSFSFTPSLSDNGSKYRCVLSETGYSKTSREATILTDVAPPTLISARTLGNPNQVIVTFSEDVVVPANASGFSIDNGIVVSGLTAGADAKTLILTTTTLSQDKVFTLKVSGVSDLFRNVIQANSPIVIDFSVEVPLEFGQAVSGFQDDFSSGERDPNWVPVGAGGDLYEQTDGILKVTTNTGDPNHLLYEASDYDPIAQEVLMRARITAFGTGDNPRGGISVAIDGTSSRGINLHFRDSLQDGVPGRQFKLLNDFLFWGPPGLKPDWTLNTWYWLRLRQTGNDISDGSTNIYAKAWVADGLVPEPPDWQMTWSQGGRAGFAGIAGSTGGGLGEFEVDYILIKADGLPTINVEAEAFALAPGALRFTSATLVGGAAVIAWTGTGALQEAPTILGPWTEVPAATNPYTIPATSPRAFYRLQH